MEVYCHRTVHRLIQSPGSDVQATSPMTTFSVCLLYKIAILPYLGLVQYNRAVINSPSNDETTARPVIVYTALNLILMKKKQPTIFCIDPLCRSM